MGVNTQIMQMLCVIVKESGLICCSASKLLHLPLFIFDFLEKLLCVDLVVPCQIIVRPQVWILSLYFLDLIIAMTEKFDARILL